MPRKFKKENNQGDAQNNQNDQARNESNPKPETGSIVSRLVKMTASSNI